MKKIPCKCFAPATVANVAVGYDVLGFAINDLGDELIVREGTEPGLKISAVRGMKSLPKDIMNNTAGYAAYKLMELLGVTDMPIEIELIKNMPVGTGLGSSAASAVVGAFAINEYLGRPASEKDVLRCATLAEELADGSFHADNVAPSLMGGMILIRDNPSLDVIRLPVIEGLRAVVIYPHIKILTKHSRSVLSDQVSLKNHVKQSGNLAAFVAALYRMDLDGLQRSLEDVIIEPQRSKLIPHFYEMKEAALYHGALGFSISGAGPSMFALCANSVVAENIVDSANQIYFDKGVDITNYNSVINLQGAKKY